MKRIQRILYLCLLISVLLMLSGCGGWYSQETEYLVRFVERTVPYTYSSPPGTVGILEEDSYGRMLLRYGDTNIRAYVICQNTNHTNACYYYEDLHAIVTDSIEDISEQDINELKAQNDWGKMLDPSKMAKCVGQRSSSVYQDFSKVEEAVRNFGNYPQENVEVYVDDVINDDSSKQLMVVNVYEKNGPRLKSYFALSALYPKESLVIEEIQDYYHYQEQVIRMKRENKWARRTVKFTDLYLGE